jgi:hypothetical protein
MPLFALLLIDGTDEPDPEIDHSPEAHGRHAASLLERGHLKAAMAFGPPDEARLVGRHGTSMVNRSDSAVLGVAVVEAESLDTACSLAAENPLIAGGGQIEVRTVIGTHFPADDTASDER